MVNLNWCFKQAKGIKFVESNLQIAKAYLKDAKRDFSLIDKKEPKWNIIKEYYVCYNSLYSLLVKCGIKCEIHDCTIRLMSLFDFDQKEINFLEDLKSKRVDVQYYLKEIKFKDDLKIKNFILKCELILKELNFEKIDQIRSVLK